MSTASSSQDVSGLVGGSFDEGVSASESGETQRTESVAGISGEVSGVPESKAGEGVGGTDGGADGETEDGMTEEELRDKYLKRAAVTSDDVDLIMASRQKKWSIDVPVTPVEHGSTVRPAEIEDDDMTHLMMEIKEGEFDKNASRPDLELLVVGKGAKLEEPSVYLRKNYREQLAAYKLAQKNAQSAKERKKLKKPKKGKLDQLLAKFPIGDTSKGNGIELPFDSARKVFVLSPTLEDRLILLVRNDLAKACVINSGVTYFGKLTQAYIDAPKQRLWRRMIREHILPKLDDEKRMVAIARRVKAAKEAKALKEKVYTAEEVEYSDTDSGED